MSSFTRSVPQAISAGSTQIPFKQETHTIAAGEYLDIFVVYNYFRVMSLSGGTLQLQFGQNGLITPFVGAGVGLRFEFTYDRIRVLNTHATDPMDITAVFALGYVNDDRLNVSGVVQIENAAGDILDVEDAAVLAMMQNNADKRTALSDLTNVAYSSITNTSATIVTALANTNGVRIVTAMCSLNGSGAGQSYTLSVGGNVIARADNGAGNVGVNSILKDIFVPAGNAIAQAANGAGTFALMTYEVL